MSGSFTFPRATGQQAGNDQHCQITPVSGRECASRVQHGRVPYPRNGSTGEIQPTLFSEWFLPIESKGRAAGAVEPLPAARFLAREIVARPVPRLFRSNSHPQNLHNSATAICHRGTESTENTKDQLRTLRAPLWLHSFF